MENILLNEYNETQKIDISKIICDECKINNKNDSYNNIFYRCNECKKNLCITCQNKHNKEHKCINYDDKNYMCNIHNEKYNSFCNKCNKNIYLFCKSEHKEHEIINYENILQNINEVKDNLDKLRKGINEYKRIIDDTINKLNIIKLILDIFMILIKIYMIY